MIKRIVLQINTNRSHHALDMAIAVGMKLDIKIIMLSGPSKLVMKGELTGYMS